MEREGPGAMGWVCLCYRIDIYLLCILYGRGAGTQSQLWNRFKAKRESE
jgi:hypothetical protein